ncbi:MAG: translation initiation factor IF-2 [Deltaproteobacteria bacterium]|nr:translation initiation factor IF-2 [Deltaproteobacteria bacterium]
MSKKRVHELGKQLKEAGIELSNQELVEKLHALGYDVKSHSSSLEEDQSQSAYERIVGEKKPKAPAPRATGPGFVVRKRAHVEPALVAPPVEEEFAPADEQARYEEKALVDDVAQEPAAKKASHPEGGAECAAGVEAAPPQEATPGEATPAAHPPSATPVPATPSRPALHAPPPGPRAATAATHPPVHRPALDTRTLRPTSTQAVVISRPTSPVRRVTPPTSTRGQYPAAPGPRALGEVRELKVVPGSLGREREFIDVSKDKKRRGTGRPGGEADKSLTPKDLLARAMTDRSFVPVRGKKKKAIKKGMKTQVTERAEHKKVIRIEESISVSALSQAMGIKASDLIRKLMTSGTMATINQQVDADTAAVLATDFGFIVEKKGFEVEEFIPEVAEDETKLVNRPPVVTVMGHVDHGKTSLLDAIRKADVASGEAGGITQHIGAYSVETAHGPVTFLDTPGHEAFTAMRQRGAQVTDLVVLVVAADDGVMPQTIEAIKHAKAAGVTMLVAINKIDKPGAAPERVMQQLTEYEMVPEQWGGTTIMMPVSARTKQGLPELLEYIALQAEVLDLKSNPEQIASGVVIEAKLEKGRGPVATVLVQEGTLRVGDALVTGSHYGKVRAMMNERGDQVKEVLPGHPVEVLGLSGVPTAGDDFNVVSDEKAAKEVAGHRAEKARAKELGSVKRATIEDLFAKAKSGGAKELNVVVKADMQGSAEAVSQALTKLSTRKVKVVVLDSGVGAVTESDVLTAAAGKGIIVGFHTKPETKVDQIASQQSVKIFLFDIIYEAADTIREEMVGLLDPIIKEKPLGKAEVRAVFNIPRAGTIAGSAVTEGVIKRGAQVRVLRERKVVHSGKIASLRRIKDDVKEVQSGFECGIGIENFADFKVGDVFDAYELEETRPSLD